MKRRDFLRNTALTGAGLMSGCMRNQPSGVIFKGWPYEPNLVQENIDFFTDQTKIDVTYQSISGNYHDKMVALFVGKTPMDCCYVRDDDFSEWVEAGWLRPCDDLPGAQQYSEDIFNYNLEAMTYQGKRYGLPYYTDFTVWVYNTQMLETAGFEKSARTLNELTEQAIKIKEKRLRSPDGYIIEYPIVLGFRQAPGMGFGDWWALNYASEVDLFDDDLTPIFPDDKDQRAEKILQWIVDGIHKHRIIDINSLTMGLIRENTAAGRQAFCLISKYDVEWVNNRQNSAVAEAYLKSRNIPPKEKTHAKTLQIAPIPSLEPDQEGTLGWTRMYCLTAHCNTDQLLNTWQFMQFLGGKDTTGDYFTSRRWFRLRGLGFAYKSLMDDPQIIAQTEQWGDIEIIKKLSQVARTRENIKAPWFPDFRVYYQPEIQKILLRQQSPRDGLARIAKRCRDFKREWT
ncbi:MAG: extracellular solute-binding protein [Candidatus Poribacteria bacterium]|nr:extracellular solute-binding protein [Candidatus Poribacteria bacterium]|tara:strand:+ start:184 stop:1551 length:1368 start_codon:yes stop_codon:yes gene_type:complete